MIQEGGTEDLFDFAYFDFPEIGSAVEVLYLNDERLPPPEAVIQPSSWMRMSGLASKKQNNLDTVSKLISELNDCL